MVVRSTVDYFVHNAIHPYLEIISIKETLFDQKQLSSFIVLLIDTITTVHTNCAHLLVFDQHYITQTHSYTVEHIGHRLEVQLLTDRCQIWNGANKRSGVAHNDNYISVRVVVLYAVCGSRMYQAKIIRSKQVDTFISSIETVALKIKGSVTCTSLELLVFVTVGRSAKAQSQNILHYKFIEYHIIQKTFQCNVSILLHVQHAYP